MITQIQLFESPDITALGFVCDVGWRAKFTKGRWIQQTNCSLAFWVLLAA